MKLTNKVAVVTGGYKGIGRGIVDTFIKYGAKVIVLDYDENVTSMKSDNILAYVVDIRDRQSVTKAVKSGVSYFGKLDILVNNAGVCKLASFEEMTDEVTLVDFFANWCGPCKMLGEELEEMKDVKIIKIDTDTHEELAREHGVMSIPYVEIYKNKELVTKFIGFKTKDEIEEILKNL